MRFWFVSSRYRKGANRLVKVQSSKDSGAVTYQLSEFYADGRRANKVVTRSGLQDGTTRYYYDGQQIH